MSPPKGNKFWMRRDRSGAKKIYETPDSLWDAAVEYFEWVEENPLFEEKAWQFQGEVIREPIAKMRAMTQSGLCFFIGISEETFRRYGECDDLCGVVRDIKSVIYNQKFSGAAADLLNSNIIARDLGLTDKQEVKADIKAETKAEVNFNEMTQQEAANAYRDLMEG